MSQHNYPHAATVALVIEREKRGVSWAKQSIELVCQNLQVTVRDIPDTPEYAEVRRALYRALDRLRHARGALTVAHDTTAEAMLIARRSAPAYIQNARLRERYAQSHNGAEMVRNARKERQRREDSYSERERWQREMERQRFLNNDPKPEDED
jgi:hypothetical protein